MSPPLHPASLVDASLHSTATLQLVGSALTDCLIGKSARKSNPLCCLPLFGLLDYVVQCTVEAVDFALGRVSAFDTSNSKDVYRHAEFTEFVSNVLSRSEVQVPVVLASLVYIHRAKPYLSIKTEQWACERVFLGALILAAKVHHSPRSVFRSFHTDLICVLLVHQ